jgi:hypothetical protein
MVISHDQQMTPIDFGVKGKCHIDLVGKNGCWSITKERLGLGTSNLVWWLVMTPIDFGVKGSKVKVSLALKVKTVSDQ